MSSALVFVCGHCCHGAVLCAVDAWTIAFSSDSRFIASGSHTGKIILYGVESGNSEVQLDTRGGKFALSIAYVRHSSSCLS